MKPGDAILIELARKAGVRPPHIFHLWSYRKSLGERFSVAGYAAFAMMEERHVEAMIVVLDAIATPAKPKRESVRSQLPEGWMMPEDWLILGRERRFWPVDVCRTEADKFVNWHRMKGNSFADWKAAWRNWIDGSRREDGTSKVENDAGWTPEKQRAYLETMRT